MHEQLTDFVARSTRCPSSARCSRAPSSTRARRPRCSSRCSATPTSSSATSSGSLAEKGRAGEIHEIAREFEALVAQDQGILDVELTTAVELSQNDFDELVARIGRASGRKVRASRAVDPGLVGGLVLQIGSRRLDASIRGRLERLRQELTTRRSSA